ncbi:MAG: cation transporter [Methanothrix sp.]|jgi:cobalt-zinc-cadmium efflux system protein|uniref:Cation diffusion facilitator family transporter n=1 Tax=Methanothrix thermoacetophila (strain DSM 6194 / JCM 14653 / NBRC 101360 / PT) TaxID=349307 RepID=A0B5Z8_METTP|nr:MULTISPECIES: cation diffusion facilitator family transporter [Methanothrix]ABK14122.1 cation diffusion facilitator family transporter [Methanothrix thermoacetophila PT]MBC7079774.1 cation transporter [Methanothrix sp.]NPU87851.1 cation transporter [Methanothrix sp.]
MIAHEVRVIERRFSLAMILTISILIAELLGSWWTGSLALLSDAAHVFLDLFALGLSWFAIRISALPASERYSYGFHRFEVIAALANGLTLGFVALVILIEAYRRLLQPEPVKGLDLLLIATFGLIVNLIVAFVLSRDGHMDDLNLRSAILHVLGDAAASLGVIAAALVIWRTGWYPADPIISLLISVMIFAGSYRLIKDSFRLIMEGVPECIRTDEVVDQISTASGVIQVHDLHIWGVCSSNILLSAHVVVSPESDHQRTLSEIRDKLSSIFGIEHATIQLENEYCGQGRVVFQKRVD